jgi:hypothetical protein
MKVYLDDERQTPEGWTRVYWPDEAIKLLMTGEVEEISLDHDLADKFMAQMEKRNEITGYDVITWIEEKVFNDASFSPPVIHIHTDNPSAKKRMLAGVRSIEKIVAKRE